MKKEFTIKGPVGELHGVIHKCPDEFESGNVMIMCHGFRGSMEGGGRAAQLAEEISERHATVVRFNFTRCAKLSVLVDELKCVIDYVRETLDPEYLILLGRSFGGAACGLRLIACRIRLRAFLNRCIRMPFMTPF